MSVKSLVCVLLEILHTEYQDLHFTNKVRTFLGSEEGLASPQNFEAMFEGGDMVLRLRSEYGSV